MGHSDPLPNGASLKAPQAAVFRECDRVYLFALIGYKNPHFVPTYSMPTESGIVPPLKIYELTMTKTEFCNH